MVSIGLAIILGAPAAAGAHQTLDSSYPEAVALRLPELPPPVRVHYSPGHEPRALALQRGALRVRELLMDSLELRPADLTLLVLDETDWAAVAEMPYGLYTLLTDPPVFLAPAEVDRGIYHDSTLPPVDARLGVDLIGLHYLAHFFSAEALYERGHAANPPVKWLDEVFTLMLQDELFDAVDPRLREASRRSEAESLRLADPRVTELADFEVEYRRYFVTPEGGANYAWFLARLARWAREIREHHGIQVIRRVRDALATSRAEVHTEDALELLEHIGIETARGFSANRPRTHNTHRWLVHGLTRVTLEEACTHHRDGFASR